MKKIELIKLSTEIISLYEPDTQHLSPFMNLIHNIYLPLWIWYTTLIPLYEPDTQHLSPFMYLVHKLTLILQYLAVLS